mgnify:CR=1 FL=1
MKKLLSSKKLVVVFAIITHCSLGQSTLNLAGSGKVHIDSGTVFTMNDLNISTGSQLVNRGHLTVNGVLANFAGTPGLILTADESGYGSLMHYTPLVAATVQQYLASERWHLVSPPVTQSQIVVYENIYLKEWSEAGAEWTYLVQPTTIPMNQYEGYSAWADNDLTGATTVSFEGSLKAGNGAFSNLSYSAASPQPGWNLVGNPYPSPVEWNTNWTLNDVGGWAIVYENGTFKGWNPWMPSGEQSYNGKTDGLISPTQGFWIRTTGESPYVFIPQSARSHGPSPFLKESEISQAQSLHLVASANGFEDETVILFMEGADPGFDALYDLEKHMNVLESPNLYSIPATGKAHAVNVLPDDWIETTEPAIIPVGFDIGINTECTITATGIESFDPSITIYLEDKKEDVLHNLHNNPEYIFGSSGQDDPDRFMLHFGDMTGIDDSQLNDISVYSFKDDIYIRNPGENNGYAVIYDMQGRTISEVLLDNELTKIKIYRTGYYIVKVQSADNVIIRNVFIKH